jgi:tetratricopeptide (TPR) repeat protein
MLSLRVSSQGQAKIKQAMQEKGWTVSEQDCRPLKEASKCFVQQHAAANQWHVNDPRWLRDFEQFFRVENDQDINTIKRRIAQSRRGSLIERIEQLIEAGDILVKDISYGTWNRFTSQSQRHSIRERAFKAYCHSLELNWQEIAELSETQDVTASETRSHPYHNLPARYHTALIGRDQELTRLLELLCDRQINHISVEGIGGAGKTSLVLEAAYRCLEVSPEARVADARSAVNASVQPTFNAIIFTSAKQQHLTSNHILQRHRRERTLNDIFRAIFRTLECPGIIPADFDQQLEFIHTRLQQLDTLLIVDNLETLEDQEAVLSFLYELPPTVKSVITTRVRGGFGVPIHLEGLSIAQAMRLIEHQAQEQSVQLNPEQSQAIYQRTSGLPLGIVYAIGQLSVYGVSTDVLATRLQAKSDLAQYCFEDSVQRLRGEPAHRLLMGLALFARSASKDAIALCAVPEAIAQNALLAADCLNALAQLYRLRLVMQRQERYDMHPLTREYALAELKANPEFEQQARERWVNWYLEFSQPYGQHHWRQWHEYEDLEQEWENLQAVIDWCIHQNRYEQVKKFWQHVKGYTYVHGYWHERLTWIDWLLQAAEQRQDRSTIAEALRDKGWTLILMLMGKQEQLAEVDALFSQVSELQESADPIIQLELIIDRVVLSIHQRKFDQAHQLLHQGRDLLNCFQIEESTRLHQQIRIDYYQAEVWFRTENYEQAKIGFQKVLEQARIVRWQQIEAYSLHWLAEVFLITEGNIDEAERLLNMSMPLALARQDMRSITIHKRSWAYLEKTRGNYPEFRRWATEAKEGFESLGMQAEAQEMQSWLED